LQGVSPFGSGSTGGGTTVINEVAPVGTLIDYAGDIAPEGYLLCDGSVYNIDRYPELFRIIGTTYGEDGADTFKVPEINIDPFKKYIKF
jgi:microcystin-dependent protein